MLFQQIQLGIPAIWIKTTDPYRLEENIISFDKRTYFTISKDGFSQNVNFQWKPVLVSIPAPEEGAPPMVKTTTDLSLSFDYMFNSPDVKDLSKSFIFNLVGDPKAFANEFSGLISSLHSDYRKSFKSDDISLR